MPQLPSSDNSTRLANAALIAMGSRPMESFQDKTISARTMKHAYLDVLESLLSSYPWRFARSTLALSLVPHNQRISEWDYSYRWPAQGLVLHEVWDQKDESPVRFDIAFEARGNSPGRRILTNTAPTIREVKTSVTPGGLSTFPGGVLALDLRSDEKLEDRGADGYWIVGRQSTLSGEFTVRVPTSELPGYFRMAFIHALAAETCLAITSDHGIQQRLAQDAQRELAFAKSRDAQSRTQPRIDTGLILRVRRGGARSRFANQGG